MNNSTGDLFLFIALLVGLFVLWVGSGGPERGGIDTAGPRVGSGTEIREGSSGGVGAEPKSRREIERELENTERDLEEIQEELEEARLRGEGSPYEGKITIVSSDPRESIAQFEYITLRASRNNEENIVITGWKLESALTGAFGFIGNAVRLPYPGRVNNERPLMLAPGEEAVITSGRSPVGLSFLINECTGYFQQYQPYTPRLPERCPLPESEFKEFGPFTITSVRDDDYDQCLAYVRRNTDRCEIVTTNLNERDTLGNFLIEPPLSNSCQAFIKDDLNYTTCVNNHRDEFSFFKDEWRVFLGSFAELWRKNNDIIRLLDEQGKTVDIFSYD